MRSFYAATLCLSLIHASNALIPHSFRDLIQREADPESETGVLSWLNRLLKKHLTQRQDDGTCVEDAYYDFVFNSSFGQSFCQAYMKYPNITTTVEYTPTSTATNIFTTRVKTSTAVFRTTPHTTVTVTVSSTPAGNVKRNAQITPMPQSISETDISDVFNMFRRRAATANGTDSDAAMSAAFSSACNCQTYVGSTVTATYTHEPTVTTISAFGRSQTTVTTTLIDPTETDTVTVYAPGTTSSPPVYGATGSSARSSSNLPTSQALGESSSMKASSAASTESATSTSSTASTPIAPPFTCPDDNNQTVSQLVGNERFDYLVLCDTVVSGPTFYGALAYTTLSQCVAACSMADRNFNQPVCQAVEYYDSSNIDGYNCFLRSSAANATMAVGVDTAVLQRIAVGITDDNAAGTSTESAPFSGESPTIPPRSMSASMSSMMGNSSSTMPIITPNPVPVSGRAGQGAVTYYSTYISDGSTFSTHSVFSTYYSGNNSWYESYYTTFSDAWASGTTVYASSETGASISNSSSSSSSEQSTGNNGEYSIVTDTNSTTYYMNGNQTVTNVTEVISNNTYAANGTQIGASTTTMFYSSTSTSGSGSGSGNTGSQSGMGSNSTTGNGSESGGNNGVASGGAGIITPVAYTSTSIISTQTVILHSSATHGGSGYASSGVIQTSPPESTYSVKINSYGTAYSSGYVVSGAISSNGISGGYGTAASGVITPPGTAASPTVVINSYGTAYSSGYVESGAVSSNGTSGKSGTAASGVITPTGTTPFNNTNAPRSGTDSTTRIMATLSYTGIVYSPPPSYPSGPYSASAYSSVPAPTGTSSTPFSNTNAPRSGTESTISTIPVLNTSSALIYTPPPFYTAPTAPASSGIPVKSFNSTSPFSNTGAPRSGTESSTLTPPAPYSSPHITGPIAYPPLSTGTAPSGLPPAVSNSTVSVIPTGSSPYTAFSNTNAPRSGTESSKVLLSTGTAPPSYPISSTGTAPPSHTTCANGTMGTTTVLLTTTMYGCYSSCYPPPGGYGGPQSFGPPVFPTGGL